VRNQGVTERAHSCPWNLAIITTDRDVCAPLKKDNFLSLLTAVCHHTVQTILLSVVFIRIRISPISTYLSVLSAEIVVEPSCYKYFQVYP